MALQVWLPLTGHLENQGLSDITVTNNGATVDNSGKLGQCYKFNNTAALSTHIDVSQFANHFSFSGWVKYTSTTSAQYIFHLGGATWQNKYALSEDYGGTIVYYIDGTENRTTLSTTNTLNQWVHYVYTYDGSTVKIYVNGTLGYSASKSPGSFTPSDNLTFGARVNNSAGTAFAYGMQNGYLNDIRIYDHALSPKEVKLLSQGLVCHYTLGDVGGCPNLLPYSKVSTANKDLLKTNIISSWNNLSITTIDGFDAYLYPTTQSPTWFSTGYWYKNMTANTTYTYSAYIYQDSSSSYSFNFASLGHFQVYNSSSTASDKTHEDVVSARVYSPATIPPKTWTKISITFTTNTLAGSNFQVYPRYNIGANTFNLYFRDCKLELGSKATPWLPNSSDTEYTTMGYNDTTVYDCSGYNYHGTKTGDLTVSSDTSRYSLSTHFNGTSYSYLTSISPEIASISLWVKWDSIPSGQSVVFMDYKSKIGFGLMSTGILCGSVSGSYYTFNKSNIVANTWYHFVIVSPDGANSATRKLYINGVEQTPTSYTSVWSYSIDELQIGRRSYTSDGFVGKISDFRAYATVLSADDIQQLYNAPVSISNNGAMFTQGEFIES